MKKLIFLHGYGGEPIPAGSGTESDIKQKQVEALSLDESMKPETH